MNITKSSSKKKLAGATRGDTESPSLGNPVGLPVIIKKTVRQSVSE